MTASLQAAALYRHPEAGKQTVKYWLFEVAILNIVGL